MIGKNKRWENCTITPPPRFTKITLFVPIFLFVQRPHLLFKINYNHISCNLTLLNPLENIIKNHMAYFFFLFKEFEYDMELPTNCKKHSNNLSNHTIFFIIVC